MLPNVMIMDWIPEIASKSLQLNVFIIKIAVAMTFLHSNRKPKTCLPHFLFLIYFKPNEVNLCGPFTLVYAVIHPHMIYKAVLANLKESTSSSCSSSPLPISHVKMLNTSHDVQVVCMLSLWVTCEFIWANAWLCPENMISC